MPIDNVFDELKETMTNALFQMSVLTEPDVSQHPDFLAMIKVFIIGVMSTAADLAETTTTGAAPWLYAEIETAAKHGGLKTIIDTTTAKNEYSIAEIAADDPVNAMNYIGQQLSTTLFKSVHELPTPLRQPEMLLRGVEALLTNLLNQKFGNDSHRILDSLCEHVHMSLDDLQSREKLH